MIPAKNRDRKCSTCRHYQPSPLWRKGWCRNPLLYDRNTNHLVEADSLACNRTFIDYWEPVTGPAHPVGPQGRPNRPRIAPSIPVNTTDPKGRRSIVTGNTPAAGMAAVNDLEEAAAAVGRDGRKLVVVKPGYEPEDDELGEDPAKVTRQIEQVPGPESEDVQRTAAQRIRAARNKQRSPYLDYKTMQGRITLLLLAVVVLAALAGGAMVLGRQGDGRVAGVVPTPSVTQVVPTPTGLGDATTTPLAVPTQPPAPPPPSDVIAVNGWAQVRANGGLSVRESPGTSSRRVTVLRDGVKARVVEGPQEAAGLTWWKIDSFDPANPATTGWCAAQFLVPTTAP